MNFEELQPAMFAIAYRMLGSVADAEDAVQETFLRLHRALAAGERIESPRAYAATVVTRLCIDQLRSARRRRETYVGNWLPEPVLDDADPAGQVELADSLSLAFLVLLESLSPEQRAAFLLRDIFDYPFDEIAMVIGKTPNTVRQLVVRARRYVTAHRPRFEASPEAREALARGFFAAAARGDLDALEELLAEDVVLHGDGGGLAPAPPRPLHGRARVAKALVAWVHAINRSGGMEVLAAQVNGQPGARVLDHAGRLIGVLAVDIAADRVQAVHSVVNPAKLIHLGPVGDLEALLRERS
ncbi:RNA polymerase sigma-70 factor [Nocardia sp. NPDC051832]|uniref:RNA polymerase sigma-70 factor n=1 Tax=Nocardia sp. NPDC051832 TaxID=3155673 RepID=UPI003449BA9C